MRQKRKRRKICITCKWAISPTAIEKLVVCTSVNVNDVIKLYAQDYDKCPYWATDNKRGVRQVRSL